MEGESTILGSGKERKEVYSPPVQGDEMVKIHSERPFPKKKHSKDKQKMKSKEDEMEQKEGEVAN